MSQKHKCKNCPTRSIDAIKIGLSYFCNNDFKCATEWSKNEAKKKQDKLRKAKVREVKTREKESRKKYREDKARIKATSKLIAEAQQAVNLYVRLRDYWRPCCSCGAPKKQIEVEQGYRAGGCWDAGHFRSRGAAGQLRFNLLNNHKQCKCCNGGERKNAGKAESVRAGYEAFMVDRYGLEKMKQLKYDNSIDLHKNDRERLVRIKTIFRRRARYYQKRIDAGVKHR